MVCGPLLRALLPADREALLYGEKQTSNLMPPQFDVSMVAALKYFSQLTCKRYAVIVFKTSYVLKTSNERRRVIVGL